MPKPAENEEIEQDEGEKEAPEKQTATVKEDEDGAAVVSLPEGRKPRKERRQEHKEDETRRWREEAESLRRRVSEMESNFGSRLNEVQQRVSQPENPFESEVKNIRREQETLQATFRTGGVSEADAQRLRDRYYELQERERQVERDRLKQEITQQVRQEQSQQQGQYEEASLRSEFPEVIANPAAVRWAVGLYQQMIAEGKSPTLATSREAMTKASERFNLRPPTMPAASQAQQQRYGAVPAQAGTRSTSNEVRLEPWAKKMALARWPQDDEHVAYAKLAALLRKSQSEEQSTE